MLEVIFGQCQVLNVSSYILIHPTIKTKSLFAARIPESFDFQEICDDDKGARDKGVLAVLSRPESIQWLQVPMRGYAEQCLSDAVVRATEQVHAAKGEPMNKICNEMPIRFYIQSYGSHPIM